MQNFTGINSEEFYMYQQCRILQLSKVPNFTGIKSAEFYRYQ